MLNMEDIEQLKVIFVQKEDCSENRSEIKKDVQNNKTDIAVSNSKLNMIIWLLCAIGGGIITMLIKMFFGG